MRKNLIVLSSFIALTALIGCDKTPKTIKIVGPNIVCCNQNYKYTIQVTPNNAIKDVKWSVSDSAKSIATIDENNGFLKVSGYTENTEFTITATSKKNDKIKDTFAVTAVAAEKINDISEWCGLYNTAYGNLTTKLTEAGESGLKCKFGESDYTYFEDEKVVPTEGLYIKTTEGNELYLNANYSMVIPTSETFTTMFNSTKSVFGDKAVNLFKLTTGELYYYIYIEYEDEGVTKYHFDFTGFDTDGFIITEYIYSNYIAEEQELPTSDITYLNPKLV